MSAKRSRLTAMGFNTQNFSDEQLERLTPQQMAELAQTGAPKGQQGQPSLLGAKPEPSAEEYGGGMTYPEQTEVTTPKEGGGAPGTWETAAMAVSKSIPSIIQMAQFRQPRAPAANVGGRRTMDIPSAASTFGKNDPRFQSLLAMFLKR